MNRLNGNHDHVVHARYSTVLSDMLAVLGPSGAGKVSVQINPSGDTEYTSMNEPFLINGCKCYILFMFSFSDYLYSNAYTPKCRRRRRYATLWRDYTGWQALDRTRVSTALLRYELLEDRAMLDVCVVYCRLMLFTNAFPWQWLGSMIHTGNI